MTMGKFNLGNFNDYKAWYWQQQKCEGAIDRRARRYTGKADYCQCEPNAAVFRAVRYCMWCGLPIGPASKTWASATPPCCPPY